MQPADAYACDKTPTMASSPIVNAGLYLLNPGKAVLDLKAYAALLFEAAEPSNFQGYKPTLWPLSPPNLVIMSCFILLAPRAMAE